MSIPAPKATLVPAFVLVAQQAPPFQVCQVLGYLGHVVADHVHAVVRRVVPDVVDVGVVELHDRTGLLHLRGSMEAKRVQRGLV